MLSIVACASAPPERSIRAAPRASASPAASSPLAPEVAAKIDAAAREPDEEALVRLGDDLGARPLIAATRDPARRKTALAALVHTVDREIAVLPLARLANEGGGDDELVLETIARLCEAPGFDELIDPEGIVEGHALLRALAADASRTADVRALAETAFRRLEEYARGRIALSSPPPKR